MEIIKELQILEGFRSIRKYNLTMTKLKDILSCFLKYSRDFF